MSIRFIKEILGLIEVDGATLYIPNIGSWSNVVGMAQFYEDDLFMYCGAFPESDHDFHIVKVLDVQKIHERGFNFAVQFGSTREPDGEFIVSGESPSVAYLYGIDSIDEKEREEFQRWRKELKKDPAKMDAMFDQMEDIFLLKKIKQEGVQGV